MFSGKPDRNLKVSDNGFVPDYTSLDELLDGIGGLFDEDREGLSLPFVIEELEAAVKGADNNKSLGLDGLVMSFINRFWGW